MAGVRREADAGSIAVPAAALQQAHRLARGVEALAPRSDRRQPEANPRDQWDPPPRSRVGAPSARSADGEICPRVRGVPDVVAHANPKRCSLCRFYVKKLMVMAVPWSGWGAWSRCQMRRARWRLRQRMASLVLLPSERL